MFSFQDSPRRHEEHEGKAKFSRIHAKFLKYNFIIGLFLEKSLCVSASLC
jgi:hypothetical protein